MGVCGGGLCQVSLGFRSKTPGKESGASASSQVCGGIGGGTACRLALELSGAGGRGQAGAAWKKEEKEKMGKQEEIQRRNIC